MSPSEIKEVVRETLRQLGKLETVVIQAEAFRRYGRGRVTKLTGQGYLKRIRDDENGSIFYDAEQLTEVMKNNNVLEKFKLKPKQKLCKR